MTSGPLKREGMLASTVSQSNVVLTPAAIARVRGPCTDRQHPYNPSVVLLLGGSHPTRLVGSDLSLMSLRLLESLSSTVASW